MFGEVLFRHGDYYGPIVNLAARLVDAAIPGEALVDRSVVEAMKDDDLVFEPAGRRMLKGFDEPVAVWSLAPTRRLTSPGRAHRPLRAQPDRAVARRQPAHGDAGLAVRPGRRARRFLVRIDDLDRAAVPARARASPTWPTSPRSASTGDGAVVRQSDRFAVYEAALDRLDRGRPALPVLLHPARGARGGGGPPRPPSRGRVPGHVSRPHRRRAAGREPPGAGRRGGCAPAGRGSRSTTAATGAIEGVVDDFVVRRADGAPAYQVAVVVDDDAQGVGEVVRGDDLLDTTPRQVWLARLLGLAVPAYAHVPLVLGPDGERLAKRHGAVTLGDLRAAGVDAPRRARVAGRVVGPAARRARVGSVGDLLAAFSPESVPRDPWVFPVGHVA